MNYDRDIANLKAECDKLRLQVQGLTALLTDERPWPRSLNLTPSEEKLLRILYKREFLTKEQAYGSFYWDRADGGPDSKILDVHICHIRAKLPPESIETIWGRGYRLTDAGRAWLAERIEPHV